MHVLTLSHTLQSKPRFSAHALAMSALCIGVGLGVAACNALDAPGPKGSVVVIPTDARVAQLTAAPPAPISGGTLSVSLDGKLAVAADPDRDRVSIVNLDTQSVQHVALESGDEPGRVVLDDAGRAYVALRRGAALAVIDLVRGKLQQRVPVCAAPRGMAFDAEQRLVHVACMDGRLLSVGPVSNSPSQPNAAADLQPAAAEQTVLRDVQVGLDLRDVMFRGKELWVSSFKRVELMHIGADGQVMERVAPSDFALSEVTSFENPGMTRARVLQPHLAYRSFSDASGNLFVLHQGESTEEVAIDQPSDGEPGEQSPYGGSEGACGGGIVTPAITTIDSKGGMATVAAQSGVLSVDMAVSAWCTRVRSTRAHRSVKRSSTRMALVASPHPRASVRASAPVPASPTVRPPCSAFSTGAKRSKAACSASVLVSAGNPQPSRFGRAR
jgi:hypothetical protein